MMKKELKLVHQVAKQIERAGGRLYYVGGYVRDRLLGRDSKDIDVEIHGVTEAELIEVLKQFGQVDFVGESFGVYLIKGVDIDFCLPRRERKTGEKHTDFEVITDPFMGTFEASKRRDFTINAIMEDVLTGEIIDHFYGVDDIANRVIRVVDNVTFQEDSLRVLRALQFSARFGFSIEPLTIELMKSMSLLHLAKERIYTEIEKGMVKGHPKHFVHLLKSFPNVIEVLPSIPFAKLKLLSSKNTFAFNVAVMSLEMSDDLAESFVKELIQDKKNRKLVAVSRRFILDVRQCTTAEELALTIASHRHFIDEHMDFINMNSMLLFESIKIDMLNRMLRQRANIPFHIDGDWLIRAGVKPSVDFKNQLEKAISLSILGMREPEIIEMFRKEVLM